MGHCNGGPCAYHFLVGGVVFGSFIRSPGVAIVVKRLKMKPHVVVCCVMIFFLSWLSLFALIFKGCVRPSYAEIGLDFSIIVSS